MSSLSSPRPWSALLVAGCAVLALLGCAADDPVATARVERTDFVHRITAEGVIEAARVTLITVPAQPRRRGRIGWLAPEGSEVAAGEVVARLDREEIEQQLEDANGELERNRIERLQTQSESAKALAGAEAQRALAEIDLDAARRFKRTDTELYSRLEIVEDAVDEELASDRRGHAEEIGALRRKLAATDLELLAIEAEKARLDLEAARDGLNALEVRAPHAGLLTWHRDFRGEPPQVGAYVWPGQTLAELPDLSALEAEVYVLEADAAGLEVGKPARVVIEAHPERVYDAVIARVDTLARPRSEGSPVQYFGVTLELAETDAAVMKPGQRVRATLELERVPGALVVPRQAVLEDAEGAYVFVEQAGDLVDRRVELGPASLGLRVVRSGLEEGERVALAPPGVGGGRESTPAAGAAAPALAAGGR